MAQEREGNGSNVLAGSPWWVRATTWVGVPTAAFVFLLWWLTMGADAKLAHIDQVVTSEAAASTTHDNRVQTSFQRLEQRQDETTRILVALCVNAAKDEAARNRCLGR